MGISNSNPPSFSNSLKVEDYYLVQGNPATQHHPTVGGRILKNRLTGKQIQQYHIKLDNSQQFQDYMDLYHWRLSQQYIVRTLHLFQQSARDLCSVSYFVRLYTERIPIKMTEIQDIPYPDNLYVLLSTLDGFSKIAQITGYFDISENMIGVNKQGQVKVWLNDNLSCITPDLGFHEKYKRTMVQKIIDIVDANTDRNSQPESVKEFISKNMRSNTFTEAIVLVREFARLHRARIPPTFQSILDLLNSPNGLRDQDFDLSQTNMVSSVSFKKSENFIKMQRSDLSAFERLQKSVANSNRYLERKGSSTKQILGNQEKENYDQYKLSSGVYKSNHPILPPSAVTQSIPVSRIVQNINATQINNNIAAHLRILQPQANIINKQSSTNIMNLNSRVSYGSFPTSSNVIQLKQTFHPHPANNIQTSQSSVFIEHPETLRQVNHQFIQESSTFNPLTANQSDQIQNQQPRIVKFIQSPSNSNCLSYSQAERSETHSAYFENRPDQISSQSKMLKIRNNQQNIDPTSFTREASRQKRNLPSFKTHQIDPDIMRDLLALKD